MERAPCTMGPLARVACAAGASTELADQVQPVLPTWDAYRRKGAVARCWQTSGDVARVTAGAGVALAQQLHQVKGRLPLARWDSRGGIACTGRRPAN